PNSGTDFEALFSADAHWSKAASKIQVFKVSTQLIMSGSDELLSRMFADLKRRNIGLAVEALILSEGPNNCGHGFEGYSSPRTMQVMAERIRKFGGDLRYVAMDEPLWYGHHYDKKNACQSSYADLARDVAQKVAMLRAVFPNVKIGDIEPLGSSGDWTNEIIQWTQAYRAAVGEPLSFVDADINWSGPAWHQQLAALAKALRGAGVALAVTYDGDGSDKTGQQWTEHAEQRFAAVESDPLTKPDIAVLQTWMAQPAHFLPEEEPGTLSWLVNRYGNRH
ncbi:MAG: hypothetical protein JO300_13095, partial [Silvibacterium sp.]|nr:hypothetical protein [Silvibacterium sp.]